MERSGARRRQHGQWLRPRQAAGVTWRESGDARGGPPSLDSCCRAAARGGQAQDLSRTHVLTDMFEFECGWRVWLRTYFTVLHMFREPKDAVLDLRRLGTVPRVRAAFGVTDNCRVHLESGGCMTS